MKVILKKGGDSVKEGIYPGRSYGYFFCRTGTFVKTNKAILTPEFL